MTHSPGPISPYHAGTASRVIQGFFPGGRPKNLEASPAPAAPVRPQVPAPVQARPASPPAPILPGRLAPGTLQPALRPGQPPRPILPTPVRPGALQPAMPLRPHLPQPILPQAPWPAAVQPFAGAKPPVPQPIQPQTARPAIVQPQAGNAFALPANFTLKPRGSGQPLPEPVQKKMEGFFNTSFADVRVHVGHEAPSIGALAFTHGTDLYFAPGQYNPQSTHGQRLLGHELAHVLQQRAGRVRNPLGSGIAVVQDPALEAEAERMGMRAASASVPIQAKPAGIGQVVAPLPGTVSRPTPVAANGAILPARSPAYGLLQRKQTVPDVLVHSQVPTQARPASSVDRVPGIVDGVTAITGARSAPAPDTSFTQRPSSPIQMRRGEGRGEKQRRKIALQGPPPAPTPGKRRRRLQEEEEQLNANLADVKRRAREAAEQARLREKAILVLQSPVRRRLAQDQMAELRQSRAERARLREQAIVKLQSGVRGRLAQDQMARLRAEREYLIEQQRQEEIEQREKDKAEALLKKKQPAKRGPNKKPEKREKWQQQEDEDVRKQNEAAQKLLASQKQLAENAEADRLKTQQAKARREKTEAEALLKREQAEILLKQERDEIRRLAREADEAGVAKMKVRENKLIADKKALIGKIANGNKEVDQLLENIIKTMDTSANPFASVGEESDELIMAAAKKWHKVVYEGQLASNLHVPGFTKDEGKPTDRQRNVKVAYRWNTAFRYLVEGNPVAGTIHVGYN